MRPAQEIPEATGSGVLRGPPGNGWEAALRAPTVNALIDIRAASEGEFIFLDSRGRPTTFTWADVSDGALRYGATFRRRGIKPGERVVLMLPTCPEYLYTFFGVMAAGAVPVPVYPPLNPRQLKPFLRTLVGILDNAEAAAMVYWEKVKPILGGALGEAKTVREAIALEDLRDGREILSCPLPALPDDTAMIQYTSGSTDQPKGVQLTHRNLLHNVHHIEEALDLDPGRDRCVSWLPLYHDMGLIGTLLGAYYSEVPLVLMAPQTFMMRPRLWLQAIDEYDATITVAPNFAYNICATRVSEEAAAALDLSSLRIAMCGAEPIQAETYESFRDRFAPSGFRPEAFLPVYGLAESTVATTIPRIGDGPTRWWLDREALEIRGEAVEVDRETPFAVAAFGVGGPLPDSEIEIRDPDRGAVLPEGKIGEVVVRGPSVMGEYFRNRAASRAVRTGDGWLRTGDLGFVRDGHLFITGRSKDLIIRYGRNYYPQDIEGVVEKVEGVRKGCVIAFGHFREATGDEEVCVLAETRRTEPGALNELRKRIRGALREEIDLSADVIELLPPRSLLKTSSGKLRRLPTRERYLAGELAPREDTRLDRIGMVAWSWLHWTRQRVRSLWRR